MFKTADEALDYIYSFINLEKSFSKENNKKEYSLDNITGILKFFGDPQKDKKIIHIAGTKGKGSITFFISYLLKESGFTVTSFLSPHLVIPNERIMYNMKNISDNELTFTANIVEPIITKNNLKPTTFELFFIIFLIYSREKKPDYLVIETGLGGRLDCTNIVEPILSVISPISYDHMNILGNSIKSISLEKAGIIKEKTPVIISKQSYNCKNIFKKAAMKKNSDFFDAVKHFKIHNARPSGNGIITDFTFNNIYFPDFHLPLLGKHQIYNFSTSLLAVSVIFPGIIDVIKTKTIKIEIPGRIELLQKNPLIILDVSHNADSARKLADALNYHFPGVKWTVLSGMTEDKDYEGFFRQIKIISSEIIITCPSKFKKSAPKEVFYSAKKHFVNTKYFESIEDAISYGLNGKNPLLVTGSFYIAGPFLEHYRTR